MESVAVIGSNGQLGSDIVEVLEEKGFVPIPLTHGQIEISRRDSVHSALKDIRPWAVVNTAAFHNVPLCERQPNRAFEVNALGAKNLAEVSEDLGFILVHISTDYVFDGSKRAPYVEGDLPNPLNAYGITKLAGEYFIQAYGKRYYILRTSGLYGRRPCRAKGYNFVSLMLKMGREKGKVRVVDDEILSPTHTLELARQISIILDVLPDFGLYHATAEGECSWYEFAKAIFEISGVKARVERAEPGEFSSGVKRPKYSVLENKKLKEMGINAFQHWREALREFFALQGV